MARMPWLFGLILGGLSITAAAQEGLELQRSVFAQPTSSILEVEEPQGERITQRFPSGNIAIERWVIESENGDFVNSGPYVEYSINGDIVVAGKYHLGSREGTWSKQLDAKNVQPLAGKLDNGFKAPFTSKAHFERGKLTGDWTCSDANGSLIFLWSFVDGKRHGESLWFNSKGEIIQSIPYENDLAHGLAKFNFQKETPANDVRFERGRMLKDERDFFPAGKNGKQIIKSQQSYLVSTSVNLAGHDWGASQVQYQAFDADDNVPHGPLVTFFSNGQRESEGQYEYGKRTGTFVWWYSNGQRKTVGEYANDKEQAEWSWWHPNGIRQARGLFNDGNRVAEWSTWNSDGKLIARVNTDTPRLAIRPAEDVVEL